MPYVYNPRLHTKADYDTLAAVMLTSGWAISVLVDKEGMPPAEMGPDPCQLGGTHGAKSVPRD